VELPIPSSSKTQGNEEIEPCSQKREVIIPMDYCPECQSALCTYSSNSYVERICWTCGYYDSNSPAFRKHPNLFKNMIHDDTDYYMGMFLGAKPKHKILSMQVTNFHMERKSSLVTETSQNQAIRIRQVLFSVTAI